MAVEPDDGPVVSTTVWSRGRERITGCRSLSFPVPPEVGLVPSLSGAVYLPSEAWSLVLSFVHWKGRGYPSFVKSLVHRRVWGFCI